MATQRCHQQFPSDIIRRPEVIIQEMCYVRTCYIITYQGLRRTMGDVGEEFWSPGAFESGGEELVNRGWKGFCIH